MVPIVKAFRQVNAFTSKQSYKMKKKMSIPVCIFRVERQKGNKLLVVRVLFLQLVQHPDLDLARVPILLNGPDDLDRILSFRPSDITRLNDLAERSFPQFLFYAICFSRGSQPTRPGEERWGGRRNEHCSAMISFRWTIK